MRLQHVYWLGGGSGAGKSTVASRIATSFGMRLYDTDGMMSEHQKRCDPATCPSLAAFVKMDMDERWLNRSPALMLETFHWFRGEAFGLIVEDLLALPADQPIIVEGFRLLPRLVKPLLGARGRAAWLIPTPEFRLSAFISRGALMDIPGKTSDPERALDNLLKRDAMFTSRVERESRDEGLPIVNVDGAMTAEESTARVAELFGFE